MHWGKPLPQEGRPFAQVIPVGVMAESFPAVARKPEKME